MPLHKVININPSTSIFLWEITESFEDLFDEVQLNDVNLIRLNTMKSELHQRGFLSVRKLLAHCGYTDFDLVYDQSGKPFLKDGKHISISHSHAFSAIALSSQNIGIDLELVKEKVLRLSPRFMDTSHLSGLPESDRMKKATIIWGIKESVFKLKNEPGISFIDHIFESPFQLSDKNCTAELRFNDTVESFAIHFESLLTEPGQDTGIAENYMIVCTLENEMLLDA
ncbi:4'-phosphopantetheinyl transferase family protein [Flavobacterium humi]|uniref:4'-phosphopantetheinyl transferase superfamily protein n=1 Tax=Flavobacterium humi TaxID=2562683 RepID=A0A4Z0LAL5_9FLAO|nr:4'-phosphopantetheinyl transferase superfamily protein [Flavobacterium humi]TGD58437.1 4'-phosphopantetheinyl transferase superfamily protein [Flavobacterium humi]